TLIESMACGTPVVAFDKGAIPEVIEHGKTGFVAHIWDELLVSIGKIGSIDRGYCREYALKTFSSSRMADGYEAIYRKIINDENRKEKIMGFGTEHHQGARN